ncbi:MAG TPA: hypothetical protein IGS53_00520 [Leptolyngbyaceae cyanobacterium M33_DOE_097]|uniref:TrbI/VirB10 family protein n=1 Tax=Oscillatoriales cyanobacterium SpSt-418 TaxID=2282169 RepID=A0A7C3KJH2_9CYAN|nr:hypothetical protein [Leptolyngbyaceae cyanobacterium M33_DOE_097]
MPQETQTTLSREEENAIAGGFDDAEDRLITQEHQLAQTEETPSPRAPSERGGIRLISVLVGVGCVMGIGAACWFLFFGEKTQTRKPTAEAKPTSTPAPPTKSEDDSLKAELAFARQRQAMEQAQQEEKADKNPEKLAKKNVKKTVGATSATTPQPARAASPSASRPSSYRTASSYRTVSQQPRSNASRSTESKAPSSNAKSEDPFTRWERLAKTGQTHFQEGQTNTADATSSDPQETLVATTGTLPVGGASKSVPSETPTAPELIPVVAINLSDTPTSDVQTDLGMSPGELGILNRSDTTPDLDTPREILIGSVVAGKITVPITWMNGESLGHGAVELTEPLKDKNGVTAFPKGTILIVDAKPIGREDSNAPNAALQVNVIGAILRQDGEVKQLPIDSRAMAVLGNDGGPIRAKISGSHPPGLMSSDDFILAIAGGAAKAGEVLNQPEVTSSFSSGDYFGSSQTTTSRSRAPNLLGALFEGGLEPVTDLIKGRINRRDSYRDTQRKAKQTQPIL